MKEWRDAFKEVTVKDWLTAAVAFVVGWAVLVFFLIFGAAV